jgi:hypothetical protein
VPVTGKVKEMALVPSSCRVLMFCLDVIDDTVMLRKQICQELIECLPELLASKSGIAIVIMVALSLVGTV